VFVEWKIRLNLKENKKSRDTIKNDRKWNIIGEHAEEEEEENASETSEKW